MHHRRHNDTYFAAYEPSSDRGFIQLCDILHDLYKLLNLRHKKCHKIPYRWQIGHDDKAINSFYDVI